MDKLRFSCKKVRYNNSMLKQVIKHILASRYRATQAGRQEKSLHIRVLGTHLF